MPFSLMDACSEEHAPREDQRIVEECDALVRRTVLSLASLPTEHSLEGAARNGLRDLRPHLEEALWVLRRIEACRDLTDQELARWRAFRMLLGAARVQEGEFHRPS